MARVQIRLDMREGDSIVFDVPDGVSFEFIRGLALSVNGEDISRVPLIVHDRDYTRLHTICRRGHPNTYDPSLDDGTEFIEAMEF